MNLILPPRLLTANPGITNLNIAIFGATGIIGNQICGLACELGFRVIVPFRGDGTDIRDLKLSQMELGQFNPIPYTVHNEQAIYDACKYADVVVNCVGRDHSTRNFSMDQVNNQTAQRIARIAKECNVPRFFHLSHIKADPESKSEFLKSKGKGEGNVLKEFPEATIIRPTIVYGYKDLFISRYARSMEKLHWLPMRNQGQNLCQPIFSADLAACVMNLIMNEESFGEIYEIGGKETYTQMDIIKRVQYYSGLETFVSDMDNLKYVPEFWINLRTKMFERVPRRDKLMCESFLECIGSDLVVSGNKKGFEDLGMRYTQTIDTFLPKALKGYNDNFVYNLFDNEME